MSSLQVEDQRLGREYASWSSLTVERRWCLGTLRDNQIKITEDDILQSYLVNWCCSCPELSSWVVCWSEEPWPRVLLLHLPFHCHWCQAPGRRYTMIVISSDIFYYTWMHWLDPRALIMLLISVFSLQSDKFSFCRLLSSSWNKYFISFKYKDFDFIVSLR